VRALRLQADRLDAAQEPRIGQTSEGQPALSVPPLPSPEQLAADHWLEHVTFEFYSPDVQAHLRAFRQAWQQARYAGNDARAREVGLQADDFMRQRGLVIVIQVPLNEATFYPGILPGSHFTEIGPRGALGRRRQGAAAPSQPLQSPTAALLRQRAAEVRRRGANALVINALIRQAEQLEAQQSAIQSVVR